MIDYFHKVGHISTDNILNVPSFDHTQLITQGLQVIKKFDEGVPELRQAYNHTYAGVRY